MTQYTTLDMNHFTGWRERNQVNIQGKKKASNQDPNFRFTSKAVFSEKLFKKE